MQRYKGVDTCSGGGGFIVHIFLGYGNKEPDRLGCLSKALQLVKAATIRTKVSRPKPLLLSLLQLYPLLHRCLNFIQRNDNENVFFWSDAFGVCACGCGCGCKFAANECGSGCCVSQISISRPLKPCLCG